MKRKSLLFLFSLSLLIFLLIFLTDFPSVKAQDGAEDFGNPTLPNWLNVTVTEDSDFVTVDNADGFVFKFRKGTAGYNIIIQNGSQIIEDERWRLEYEFKTDDWRMRGEPQSVSWERFSSYNVDVKRFYTDFEGTTFNVTYSFYGGFRPKISFEGNIAQEDTYRLVWKVTGISKTYLADEPSNYHVKFWNEGEEAIVFDYSDVYERFGNITVCETEVSANNHKLDQVFNVGFLDVGFFSLDPNFGYEGIGGAHEDMVDIVRGSVFTCPENGVANSITAYIQAFASYGTPPYVRDLRWKYGLYTHDNRSFVAQTAIGDDTVTSGTWKTLTFAVPPAIEFGVDYIIVAWAEPDAGAVSSTGWLYYTGGNADQGHFDAEPWGVFPDPLVPTHNNNKSSIYCTYTASAPSNGVPSYDGWDDGDNLYAQRRWYEINVTYTDIDGFADFNYVELRLKQGGATRAIFRYDEDTNIADIQSGSTEWEFNTSSSLFTEGGNTIVARWQFKAKWNATEEIDVEVELYCIDELPQSDIDVHSNQFDVVTNLLTASIECTDANTPDRLDVSSSVTVDFTIRYANNPASASATTLYPQDAEFTSVSIYDSANNNKGTDSSIVNGGGQVVFTSPATVGSDTYNNYIVMNDTAEYGAGTEEVLTETIITDQVVVYWEQLNDSRVDIGADIEWRVKTVLDFDDHVVGGGADALTCDWGGLTWDAGNSWFDISHTEASVTSATIGTWSGSEATYVITAVTENITETLGIYDRIQILTIACNDTDRATISTQVFFYATAQLEYTTGGTHSLGAGDSFTLSGYAFVWDAGDSRFEVTETKTTPQQVTVNAYDSGTEATYGITVGNINALSISVIWDIMNMTGLAHSGTTESTVDLIVWSDYDNTKLTTRNVNITIYLNTTEWMGVVGTTDGTGNLQFSLDDNLYESGWLNFTVRETTWDVTGYYYACNFSIQAHNASLAIFPIQFNNPGDIISVTCSYTSNATLNSTALVFEDIWFKSYLYHSTGVIYGTAMNLELHNGTFTGADFWIRNMPVPNVNGIFYYVWELYLTGSDYLLATTPASQQFTVGITIPGSPAGGSAGGEPRKYPLTVFVEDEDGMGVKNATVRVVDLYMEEFGFGITNVYGECRFDLYKGQYVVIMSYSTYTENRTITVIKAETMTFSLALKQLIPPIEIAFETGSLFLIIISIAGMLSSFYFERTGERLIGLAVGLPSICGLLYGMILAFIPTIRPFWSLPPFSTIQIPPLALPTIDIPMITLPLNIETILFMATIGVCIIGIGYYTYTRMSKKAYRKTRKKLKGHLR